MTMLDSLNACMQSLLCYLCSSMIPNSTSVNSLLRNLAKFKCSGTCSEWHTKINWRASRNKAFFPQGSIPSDPAACIGLALPIKVGTKPIHQNVLCSCLSSTCSIYLYTIYIVTFNPIILWKGYKKYKRSCMHFPRVMVKLNCCILCELYIRISITI